MSQTLGAIGNRTTCNITKSTVIAFEHKHLKVNNSCQKESLSTGAIRGDKPKIMATGLFEKSGKR